MDSLLALIEGCQIAPDTDFLDTPQGEIVFEAATIGDVALRRTVLEQLLAGNSSEEELVELTSQRGGIEGLRGLYPLLLQLHRHLVLGRRFRHGGELLLTSLPLSPSCDFAAPSSQSEGRYVLSRFALLRLEGEDLVLESPLGLSRVVLHAPCTLNLFAALRSPRGFGELVDATGLDRETLGQALGFFADSGALLRAEEGEEPIEKESLALWQFHDLLFHARSRHGRHLGGYGATYRFGREDPTEAPPTESRQCLPCEPGTTEVTTPIRLPREATGGMEKSLGKVLDQRRSRRRHGEVPISREQLEEFLRLSAGARADPRAPAGRHRPYPSGGGLYELRVFLAIGSCQGLAPGLYRYQSVEHDLSFVTGGSPDVERLLEMAAVITRAPRPVQVLLLLSADFGSMAWKYESMAYATILKDTGVLMQTMALVATAMDLALCPLGGGDSDLFSRAIGQDPWRESTVGELILGSRGD